MSKVLMIFLLAGAFTPFPAHTRIITVAPAGAQSEVAPAGAQTKVAPGGAVRSLEEAIRLAAAGDTIRVLPGRYFESEILVGKPLTITGVNYPVITARGGKQIITVLSDDVTIEGLVFSSIATSFSDDRSAIRVERAGRCRIRSNRFRDTFFGIYLARTTGCVIENNDLISNKEGETKSGNGIHLWNSHHVEIAGNSISGHRDGIYLEFSQNISVRRNRSTGNRRYGLHFMFSDSCTYLGNLFRRNEAGVAVMYSKHVDMQMNRFEDNRGTSSFGLLLKDISDSRITDSSFLRNSVGIYAEGANRIEVLRNEFSGNGRAVKIMANSIGSVFRHNSFTANTFDVTTNSRQSYSAFSENYWDAYKGYDLDRDGTGDVPFYPVRLFALIAEQNEPAIILMRSLFVDLLDAAERVLPVLTPKALVDEKPLMKAVRRQM